MRMYLLMLLAAFSVADSVLGSCSDKSSYCAAWAKLNYCTTTFVEYMKANCKKTCGHCSPVAPPTIDPYPNCKNEINFCADYNGYCNNQGYFSYLLKNCKKYCNFCHLTTTAPPTTIPVTTQPYTVPGGAKSLQPGCGKKGPGHTRIVGGVAAKPGEWPWIVTFDYLYNTANPGHHCGGTLITDEWILSAAHCFYSDMDKSRYWFSLGEHDLKTVSGHEQKIPIAEILLHPNYDDSTTDNDLALIRLTRKAVLNNRVKTVCLPDHNVTFATGTDCYVAGWGLLAEFGKGPQILQQAKVPLIDRQQCKNAHKTHLVSLAMLCAGYSQGGIDSCQGDSGGPLMCKTAEDTWFLWGVVSWGVGCGRANKYGVYAKTQALRQWVDKTVFKKN